MESYHAELGNFLFWGLAVLGAGLTGFYAFRLFFYVFLGSSRSPAAHPHESPMVMAAPLLILGVLSLVGGALGPWAHEFLAPVFSGVIPLHHEDALLEVITIGVALGGIATAAALFMTGSDRLDFAKQMLAPVYDVLLHKYYVDEIYDFFIVKPVKAIGVFMEERAEKDGIDFTVDQVGEQVREVSRGISIWQTGNVRFYALNMVAGMVTILLFVIFL